MPSEPKEKHKKADLELTEEVITTLDLSRVIRELEKLDDFLHQSGLRGKTENLPKITESLRAISQANKVSLTNSEQRKHLLSLLNELKAASKKVHISFAVEPSPAVIKKIAVWMRQNIDKQLILDVGIQPTISVGCVVRTKNKVFDMSLRNRFSESKKILAASMEAEPR